jgi:cob(I)alamin adenosyltransferase
MITAYYGNGQGKSSAALGYAVREAGNGKTACIITFLKAEVNYEFLKRLEPEIKIFRFERSKRNFNDLTSEERDEEKANLKNGLNYARKVLGAGQYDLLVLDEVLGAINEGMVSEDELKDVLKLCRPSMEIILTGGVLTAGISEFCDKVIDIKAEK